MPSVSIFCESLPAEELKDALEEANGGHAQFRLEQVRGVETTVLVAMITAAGGAIPTLIAGVLAFAKAKGSEKIVIIGKSGWEVQIPTNVPAAERADLIRLAREDTEEITV